MANLTTFEQQGQPLVTAAQGTLPDEGDPPVLDPPSFGSQYGTLHMIMDTDASGDVDDFGALATLHTLQDLGAVNLLTTIYTQSCERAPSSISALQWWRNEAKSIVNVGTIAYSAPDGSTEDCGGGSFGDYIDPVFNLPETYPRSKEVGDAPGAVETYRQALVDAESNGVTDVRIVIIGFPSNVAALLASPGDGIDPRTGADLVADTVDSIWQMGGRDADTASPLGENNVSSYATDTQQMIDLCPVPIIFQPFEIGINVDTPTTGNSRSTDHILAFAYDQTDHLGGKASFDQATLVQMVLGNMSYFSTIRGVAEMDLADSDEPMIFTEDAEGPHWYVKQDGNFSGLESLIDIMMWGDLESDADIISAIQGNGIDTSQSLPLPSEMAARVRATVTDGPDGSPIEGATVTWERDGAAIIDSAQTSVNGIADVFGLDFGRAALPEATTLIVEASGFQTESVTVNIQDDQALYEQSFALTEETPGTVTRTGTVTRDGSAVQGADVVFITRADLLANATAQTTTDASGEYSAEIPTGEEMVGIALEGADGDSTPFTEGA